MILSNKKIRIRKAIVVCVLIFNCLKISFSQEERFDIDSMAKVFISQETVDLKTFDLLFKELNQLYPEELAHLGEILLSKSIAQNNHDGIYRAHDAFGFYFMTKGYFSQAFHLLLRAKKHYEKTDNAVYKMKNYYYIARIYIAMGNLDEGILWMEKSLKIAENNPDRSSLYVSRNDLANVCFQASKVEKGKKLLEENQLEWHYLDKTNRTELLTLLGNYNLFLKKNDDAKIYYDQAHSIALELNNPLIVSSTLTNLAIYEFDHDIQKSKDYFELSLDYSLRSNYPNKICTDYFNLASWYYEVEKIDSALYFFEASFQTAAKVNAYGNMLDALEEMLVIHRDQKNWDKVDQLHQQIRDIKTQQYTALMRSFDDLAMFDDLEYTNLIRNKEQPTSPLGLDKMSFWIIVVLSTIILILSTALVVVLRIQNPIKTSI